MQSSRSLSSLLFVCLCGCGSAPHVEPLASENHAESASWATSGEVQGGDAGVSSPFEGLELSLEGAKLGEGGLPRGLRLVVRNSGPRTVRFTAPGPLCPAVTSGDRKIRFPLLAGVLTDSEGREGDTNFGPLLADLEASRPPRPQEVRLAPGRLWSREYPTASFHFFGPCGPATNLEELFRPGGVTLELALDVIIVMPPESESSQRLDDTEADEPCCRHRTNAVTIRVAEAPSIFRRFTDEYQAELLSFWGVRSSELNPDEPPPTPEEIPELLRDFDDSDFLYHVFAAQSLAELGPEARAAVPKLIEILESSTSFGDRILAARVLGAIGPEAAAAIPALMKATADAHVHVRGEVASALAKVQGKPVPGPIDPSSREPADWREPPRPETDRLDELSWSVEEEGASAKVVEFKDVERVVDDANRVLGEADGVFFVLAHSRSNSEQLPATRQMVGRMIEALRADSQLGVVFYTRRAVRHPADGKPVAASRDAKEAGIEFVRTTPRGSGSCIQVGFEAVFELIERSTAKKPVIVYVGNGLTVCPGAGPTYGDESLEGITRANDGRAAIHAFGTGEPNESFLQTLASMNGGAYVRLRQ